MKRSLVFGIIIAIVIGVGVLAAFIYSSEDIAEKSIETDSSEPKPKQFSVELNEGLGVSDVP